MRRVFTCNIIQLRSHISMLQSAADSQPRTPYRAHITSPDSKGKQSSRPGKHGRFIQCPQTTPETAHRVGALSSRLDCRYITIQSKECAVHKRSNATDTGNPCKCQTRRLQHSAHSVTVVLLFQQSPFARHTKIPGTTALWSNFVFPLLIF